MSATDMDKLGISGARNERALLALMERTGYAMIQENGQRKFGGPPPNWDGPPPGRGCEIFVGKIPRDCYEDELVPAFEKAGTLYELRLMMDFSGTNRGYAFVMYCNKGDAQKAVRILNNYEIRKGKLLGVCPSVDNCRLFVGGIPKNKTKEEILTEMRKVTDGVTDVIVYPSALDKSKNRGFAFVEYESHRTAAMARRKLIPGRIQLWGHQIAVDWAEPEQEVDEDVMSKSIPFTSPKAVKMLSECQTAWVWVKILYVRNLMLTTTEETILSVFTNACGMPLQAQPVERVKKIKDYAFVHFKDRDLAIKAMNAMNGQKIDNSTIEVVLAKPVDKAEYLRYSRNKNALPQYGEDAPIEEDPVPVDDLCEAFGYGMQMGGGGDAFLSGSFFGRGFNRTAVGVRGMMRGRGRGAAGCRGVGARGQYLPGIFRSGYTRYPPESRLYDLLPGMELTPTNPVTLKPQSAKTPTQLLEEICAKNGWGSPTYQLHSTVGREGDMELQLFLYKVTVPALAASGGSSFQPNKLCRTVDEAKLHAAEFVLMQLGIPMEGPEMYTGRPLGIPMSLAMPTGMPTQPPPPEVTYATSMIKMPPPQQIAEQYYHPPAFTTGPPPVTTIQTAPF